MAYRTTYTNVSSATAQVLAGEGILSGIFCTSVGTSGTMAIYEASSGTPIIPTYTLAAGYTNLGNIHCLAGCYVETNGAPYITFLTLEAD